MINESRLYFLVLDSLSGFCFVLKFGFQAFSPKLFLSGCHCIPTYLLFEYGLNTFDFESLTLGVLSLNAFPL